MPVTRNWPSDCITNEARYCSCARSETADVAQVEAEARRAFVIRPARPAGACPREQQRPSSDQRRVQRELVRERRQRLRRPAMSPV